MAKHDIRSPRLYLNPDAVLTVGAEIALGRGQENYLRNVLRLADGAAVLVFNGRDGEWMARLSGGRRKAVIALERRTRPQPKSSDLLFAFAPLKHARLDYLVQKAVEMGAGIVQPVLTQHTQVARVNLERMRANAIEAAEQCGILALPRIEQPVTLSRWLETLPPERVLAFCDEEAETADPIAALARAPAGPLALLIGPEGGFADAERKILVARAKTVRLSLGPRVLRADTAAVAALALIQAVRGDWRRRGYPGDNEID
jgi:16S rRNA (uracil1498-N3)-methyltransferase